MSGFRQVSRVLRKRWWSISLGGVALLAVLIYGEPFSPRYDGLTARQWVIHNGRNQLLPNREAVRHFGTSAVPMLLSESRPSGFFSVSLTIENATGKRWFDAFRSADFDRRMACLDWAKMLQTIEPGVCERLIATTANDQTALEITKLFYGERYLSTTLQSLSKQSTNVDLQVRAGHLLQVYRNTI